MQIKNIIDCNKPKRRLNFLGDDQINQKRSRNDGTKIRYKHYEQMNDDTLGVMSLNKAYKQVQNSGKMRLFKAMPQITTALLGSTIAIAQPGKITAKAGAGLGFLTLMSMIFEGEKFISKQVQKSKEKSLKQDSLNLIQENKTDKNDKKTKINNVLKGASAALALGAAALIAGKTKVIDNIYDFAQKEIAQLSKEINSFKASKKINAFISKIESKNSAKLKTLCALSPLMVMGLGSYGELKLADSLSKDIKTKTKENFEKAKNIQFLAREHFNSIEAKEI